MKEYYTIYELYYVEEVDRDYKCMICDLLIDSPFNHLVDNHNFGYRREEGVHGPDTNVMIQHRRVMR